jgi:putative FmdB family regulatory protein
VIKVPLYEYECEKCQRRFERIQKFSDPPVETCPHCEGRVRKLLSSPAIQFKGSGWYITDYSKKSGDPSSKAGAADAAKPADSKTDSKSESSTAKTESKSE